MTTKTAQVLAMRAETPPVPYKEIAMRLGSTVNGVRVLKCHARHRIYLPLRTDERAWLDAECAKDNIEWSDLIMGLIRDAMAEDGA